MNSSKNDSNGSASCHACRHFYVTWEPIFPYGCHGFGMKTRRLPSIEVSANSGERCLVFQGKSKKA